MAEENDQSFFENKSQMMGTALILILLSFFLINWGLRDGDWAYWLGLAALVVGMILAPLSRFTAGKKGEGDEEEGGGGPGEEAEESPGEEQGE